MTMTGTIPRSAAIVGAGIDAMVALRPSLVAKFNDPKSRYSAIAIGLRAQFDLMISRLAAHAAATRIGLATGNELAAVAASEYDTAISSGATTAIGDIVLGRSAGGKPQGVIRKGHRFLRPAAPTAQPLAKNAIALEATQDTVMLLGDTVAVIPVVAKSAGSSGNYPQSYAGLATDFQSVDTLFDSNLSITQGYIAGGADEGIDTKLVRRVARAEALGAYGPVDDAILSGALQVAGVRRAAILDDPSRACSAVFVADASWAWSLSLSARLLASLQNSDAPRQGFGCALTSRPIYNRWIHVVATVQVRHPSALADTTLLDAPIRSALLSYFDDRPDFYTWRKAALRGVIARASREILTCTSADVRDAITGASLAEPDTTNIGESASITHYALGDNAVQVAYGNAT